MSKISMPPGAMNRWSRWNVLCTSLGLVRYLEKLFQKSRIPVHTVLDLACGTGGMTSVLTERGYELIGVDQSPDMLAAAQEK